MTAVLNKPLWKKKHGDRLAEGQPELLEGLELVWGMFWDLSAQRQGGFSGCEAISVESIGWWMWIHGIEEDEREECFSLVQSMDIHFRKVKSEEKPPPGGSG